MFDKQITQTPIGQRYQWDRVSDADPELLRNNREAAMRVINNPDQFPKADFAACESMVRDIDDFFAEHGDLLEQFA